MSWAQAFDDSIELPDGSVLRTFRDAANYIMLLPHSEVQNRHWQTAMDCLLSAVEKRGPVMMARIAMLRALDAGPTQPSPAPRKKAAKKYKIVR